MSWWSQAKAFFKEVRASKPRSADEERVEKEDLEYVSSASEARLLDVPEGAGFLIVLAVLATIGLIVWASVMEVDEVVKAQGKIIPSKQVQVVQSAEGGILREIRVVEGQAVKKGEVVAVIKDVAAASDLSDNAKQYNFLLARLVALNAHIEGKRVLDFPAELKDQIEIMQQARERFNAEGEQDLAKVKELESVMEQRKKALDEAQSRLESAQKDAALAMEQMRMMERALKEEVVSKMKYVKAEQEANEAQAKLSQAQHEVPKAKAALAEAMQHRENYIHQRIAEYEKERHEIKRKLNTMQAKGVTLKAKVGHSEVRAPVTGTVKKINYTTIGAVLRPGADIMEIIPTDDKLIVEAKVRPRDIGFIHPGLPARVKLTAYDFSTYGGLKGEVIYVSADSITDKKGRSYFIVRVKTDRNYIVDKKGKRHIVIPGMQTETDIVVDKKSILKYILKPMLK